MPHLTVIGIGSPFGDDRVGWSVAEALAVSMRVAAYGERVLVTACRSPAGELPGLMANTDIAIVVDAVLGSAPGTVYRLAGGHLPPAATFLSSHGVGLQAMLELTEALSNSPGVTIVYGIETDAAETGAALSHGVDCAAVWVVDQIRSDIAYYCG